MGSTIAISDQNSHCMIYHPELTLVALKAIILYNLLTYNNAKETIVARDIYLHDFGDMIEKATIRQWQVQEHESITQDQTLLTFETAKAIMEAPSPVSGKVLKLHCQPGEQVTHEMPLATIELEQ